MGVSQLGYIGIDVSDLGVWRGILSDILGMEVREEGKPRFVRMDERHHRLALYEGERDRLRHVGWQADGPRSFDALVERLLGAGIAVEPGSRAECGERQVDALAKFRDPEGYANEIFHTPAEDVTPLRPGRAVSGFKTGSLGLGHVVYHCRNYRDCVDFYQNLLGFRLSDSIRWADADATFLRCNPRHHSLALLNESLGMSGGSVNHFMVEATDLDDVGRAYDLVQERGLPLIMTLGRHSNDRTTSFYFAAPGGIGIEYGFGGILVDDDNWTVRNFDTTRIWGHHLQTPPRNS